MKINPYKYPFIVIEGIDGCGKSTAMEALKSWAEMNGLNPTLAHEPTAESWAGKKIRQILFNNGRDENGLQISPDGFQRLYIFDRLELRKKVVKNLEEKGPVIFDRDYLSCVYGVAQGLSPEWLLSEHERILGEWFYVADISVILDLDPTIAARRIRKSGKVKDFFENQLELMKKVREAYLKMPEILRKVYPEIKVDIRIIDASGSIKDNALRVIEFIEPVFREKLQK